MPLAFGLPARRSFSGFNAQTLFSRSGRNALRIACVAVLGIACWAAMPLAAQTAHFGWATKTLGGSFTNAWSVAVDGSGNVYVANGNSSAITKIPPGCGSTSCATPVGGGFSFPQGVAVDGSGNIYVADSGNNAVKEILAAGGYTTVKTLSSGFNYPQGVAVDGSGNVYVADSGNNAVKEILAVGGSIPASPTINTLGNGFSYPTSVAVDGNGNVYVADWNNNAVKEILAVGGSIPASPTINTLGSGFNFAEGVAVDGSGNVYVADTYNNAVKEILAVGGSIPASPTINTLGSGFSFPPGVAVDGSGNIYVADRYNHAVKEIMTQGVSFGSAAVATATPLTLSLTFTYDTGGLSSAPSVLTQGAAGLDFTDAGTGSCTTNGTAHAYAAGDTCTVDVTFTPKFPGMRYGAAMLKDAGGNVIATGSIYGTGLAPQVTFAPGTASVVNTGGVITTNPFQLALDGAGNMYVGNYTGKNVTKITAGGGSASVLSLGTPGGTALQNITGVAVDSAGNLFIGDHQNSRILVMTPGGAVSVLSITGLNPSLGFPTALAFDGYGNLYIADFTNGRIVEVTSLVVAGSTSSGVGTVIGTGSYSFTGSTLTGLTVDSQRTIYAAARTQNNSSIVKVTAAGIASLVNTGGLTLSNPQGVFVDGMGNLYIEDTGNNRIVKVTPAGIATVVSIAGLTNPSTLGPLAFGVTVDPSGNLFISDWTNNRIVEVNISTPPSLSFAQTAVNSTSSDSPQTVTLENIGNADLSFPIPGSGNNPSISTNFQLNSTSGGTCPLTGSTSSTSGVLTAGASCTLPVSFAPTVAATISGSLMLTDNNLNASPSATQTIGLSGTGFQPVTATQAIAATVLTANHAATPFSPVTGSSGTAPLSYSVSPALPAGLSFNPSTGAVAGTPTTASSAVTYTVTVTDANSTTATASFSLTVVGDTPAISFTVPGHTYGDAPFTVSATSNSMGAFTYAVVSGPATIAGNTVTITGTGTVTLQASQAAAGNYAAGTATTSFSVTPVVPTIVFTVPGHTYGDVLFAVSATSNSTGAFTYSVVSGPATISGSTVTIIGAGVVTLQASQGADSNYVAGTQQTLFLVAQAPLSVSANNATRSYGTANPSFTGSIAGAKYNDSFTESFSTTATTAAPVGGYDIVPAAAGPNLSNYTVSATRGTLTITQAGTTTTLTASSVSVAANQNVTLTATVASSTSGTPTGTVTFLDNGTALQPVALANGTASYTTTLAPGATHALTAQYAGDTNFLVSIGAGIGTVVTVAPQDFTFSGTGSPASQTVMPGRAASFTYNLSPSNGNSSYPAAVSLAVSGCPTGATCTLSPTGFAANAGAQTVTLTVQTAGVTARSGEGRTPWSLALLLLPLAGVRRLRRSSQRLQRLLLLAAFIVAGGAALVGLSGCGNGNGLLAQQPQDYTITVTATSGVVQHASTVTLNVQ